MIFMALFLFFVIIHNYDYDLIPMVCKIIWIPVLRHILSEEKNEVKMIDHNIIIELWWLYPLQY